MARPALANHFGMGCCTDCTFALRQDIDKVVQHTLDVIKSNGYSVEKMLAASGKQESVAPRKLMILSLTTFCRLTSEDVCRIFYRLGVNISDPSVRHVIKQEKDLIYVNRVHRELRKKQLMEIVYAYIMNAEADKIKLMSKIPEIMSILMTTYPQTTVENARMLAWMIICKTLD